MKDKFTIGTFKWINNEKGFGLLSNGEEDYFFHKSNLKKADKDIELRGYYRFEKGFDQKKDQLEALKVEKIDQPDFNDALQILNRNSHLVTREIKHQKVTVSILLWVIRELITNRSEVDFINGFVSLVTKLDESNKHSQASELINKLLLLLKGRPGNKSKLYSKDFVERLFEKLKENASEQVSIILWKNRIHEIVLKESELIFKSKRTSLKELGFTNKSLLENYNLLSPSEILGFMVIEGIEYESIIQLRKNLNIQDQEIDQDFFRDSYDRSKKLFLEEIGNFIQIFGFESETDSAEFKSGLVKFIYNSEINKPFRRLHRKDDEDHTSILIEELNHLIEIFENGISTAEQVLLWDRGYYEYKTNLINHVNNDLEGERENYSLPFDEKVLTEYVELINLNNDDLFSLYGITDDTLIQLYAKRYKNELTCADIKEIWQSLQNKKNIAPKILEAFKPRITNDLIFEVWRDGELVIDIETGEINKARKDFFKYRKGTQISKEILLENIDKLGYPDFKKIYHRLATDKNEMYSELLNLSLKKSFLFAELDQVIELIKAPAVYNKKELLLTLLEYHSEIAFKKILYLNSFGRELDFTLSDLIKESGKTDEIKKYYKKLLTKNDAPPQNIVSILSLVDAIKVYNYLELHGDALPDKFLIELLNSNLDADLIRLITKSWKFDDTTVTSKLFEKVIPHDAVDNSFYERFYAKLVDYDGILIFNLYKAANFELKKENLLEFIDSLSNKERIQILNELGRELSLKPVLQYWDYSNSSTTLELIKLLDPEEITENDFVISKLKENANHYDFETLRLLYEKTEIRELESHIYEKINVEKISSVLSLPEIGQSLVTKWIQENESDLNLQEYIHLCKLSEENDNSLSQLTLSDWIVAQSDFSISSLLTDRSLDKIKNLKSIDLESSLIKAIQEGLSNRNLFTIIKEVDSPEVLKYALNHFNYLKNENDEAFFNDYIDENYKGQNKELLELLTEKKLPAEIDQNLLEALWKLQNDFPQETLTAISTINPALISKYLNQLEITDQNFAILVSYFNKYQPPKIDTSSDVSCLLSFLKDPVNYVDEINSLLKKRMYSFQLPLYKYLTYSYYKNELTKEQLVQLLSEIKGVQLSALLYKLVMLNPLADREKMLRFMNQLLINHFTLMEREGLSKDIFKQVFNLRGLVNKCDGRKSLLNGEFWGGDGNQRYYVEDGSELEYIENGWEDIYCEGRLWTRTPVYNAQLNTFTGKYCNVYWCRNKTCLGVNNKTHFEGSFENWTLNDVNELFNIGLDQLAFSHISGWLNRMNTILESLNCRECKNLLRPHSFVPNQLGYYAVPLFNCVNESCSKYHRKVRFTHCRGCGKILDSRDCKTCSHCNWLRCDDENCGQCGCGADYQPVIPQY
ncbi:MAG: hypothetical protein WD016_10105 [Balneolaceae bacterium]